jgi:hypothetical protein
MGAKLLRAKPKKAARSLIQVLFELKGDILPAYVRMNLALLYCPHLFGRNGDPRLKVS